VVLDSSVQWRPTILIAPLGTCTWASRTLSLPLVAA